MGAHWRAMRFLLPLALALALLTGPAKANGIINVYGVGLASCAKWMPNRENEIIGYIFGYWTGINTVADQEWNDGLVGRKTDSEAVIEEVRLRCRQHPSMMLNQAIYDTYLKIRAQEQQGQ